MQAVVTGHLTQQVPSAFPEHLRRVREHILLPVLRLILTAAAHKTYLHLFIIILQFRAAIQNQLQAVLQLKTF